MRNGTRPLVLASSSPRRKEILALLGLPFIVVPADVSEKPLAGERPDEAARRVALAKARAAAETLEPAVVLGADTIVVLDGRILGKPGGIDEAAEMLRALRGRKHEVITGIAVLAAGDRRESISAITSGVTMREYAEAEIEAYVASGDPLDKAGAYAVQNSHFRPAASVAGCYLNVVGLPLCAVATALRAVGYPLPPVPQDRLCAACRSCEQREVLARGWT